MNHDLPSPTSVSLRTHIEDLDTLLASVTADTWGDTCFEARSRLAKLLLALREEAQPTLAHDLDDLLRGYAGVGVKRDVRELLDELYSITARHRYGVAYLLTAEEVGLMAASEHELRKSNEGRGAQLTLDLSGSVTLVGLLQVALAQPLVEDARTFGRGMVNGIITNIRNHGCRALAQRLERSSESGRMSSVLSLGASSSTTTGKTR